ncbi:MAG: hypothetical protein GXO81_05975 [Chlorobi bacterium]|nr:hypothetical protein [Chlorobiota bacterium]
MEVIKIILLAVALLSLAMLGLAMRILLKKGGRFPNTHVSGNKHLRKQGISCAQTYDRIEQAKARKEINYKNLTFFQNK